MSNLEVLQQFVIAYPQWKLWLVYEPDVYGLGYNLYTGSDTYNFNPESPGAKVFTVPSLLYFYLNSVKSITLQGSMLIINSAFTLYQCDGGLGTISTRKL
jgi:hypothetical protein